MGIGINELNGAEVIRVDPDYYTKYINWKGIINYLTTDAATNLDISERHLLRLKQKVRADEPIPIRKRTKARLLRWYNR